MPRVRRCVRSSSLPRISEPPRDSVAPNGTRERGKGLLLLGLLRWTAEQARHFFFEAVEHGFRFRRAFGRTGRGLVRSGRRRFPVGVFRRRGGRLWRRTLLRRAGTAQRCFKPLRHIGERRIGRRRFGGGRDRRRGWFVGARNGFGCARRDARRQWCTRERFWAWDASAGLRAREGWTRRRLGRRPATFVVECARRIGERTRTFGARHGNVARRIHRHRAHDVLLDDEIAWATEHQQMLDVVAPDQHEAAPPVDRRSVNYRESWLTAALRAVADSRAAEAANEPEGQADKSEHDHERDDEAYDQ